MSHIKLEVSNIFLKVIRVSHADVAGDEASICLEKIL
jgi:hypothetical protein